MTGDSNRARHRRQSLTVVEIMTLVAGVAVGFWLVFDGQEVGRDKRMGGLPDVMAMSTAVLGGLSFAGVPLLLLERFRTRDQRAWGPGKLLWFSSGAAAWLLWPPIVVGRWRGGTFEASTSGTCFAYGTPLMAVYVLAALLTGRRLTRRRRKAIRGSWRETFGLWLGAAWACTGLYVLSLIYRDAPR